ncbi:MAG0920 family protein [Mycoplasmopsis felifaucium]|uniref:MAG0920 family protein n=1 Tax=Mycoplasmopsis felifaucium TaxID=35768 RepID=UPI003CC87F11
MYETINWLHNHFLQIVYPVFYGVVLLTSLFYTPIVLKYFFIRVLVGYLAIILIYIFYFALALTVFTLFNIYNFEIPYKLDTTLSLNIFLIGFPIVILFKYYFRVKKIMKQNININDSRLLENIIKEDENKTFQISFENKNTFINPSPAVADVSKFKTKKIKSFKTKNRYWIYWYAICNYETLSIDNGINANKLSFGSFYNSFKSSGWITE